MNLDLITHRKAIETLYAECSLVDILKHANSFPNTKKGDLEFSNFQRDVLQSAFPGFVYEFCATSTVTSDENLMPTDISSVCLDLREGILESYMRNIQHDELSPIIYLNPGRALNYSQVCRNEKVSGHPFFVHHCLSYGIHRAISVGYLYPAHRSTFITFDYLGGEHNASWNNFVHSRLELASFPFALAWLYRRGKIDKAELSHRFKVLQDLTESQLTNLRKFINSPNESLTQQATSLLIQPGTLKDDLYKTRNKIEDRFGDDRATSQEKTRRSLRPLEAYCDFLKMLGDNTRELVLPNND